MRNKKVHKSMERTKTHKVRLTQAQYESLRTLKKYDINLSQFIRAAIKEKLQRDWKEIKEKKNKIQLPF